MGSAAAAGDRQGHRVGAGRGVAVLDRGPLPGALPSPKFHESFGDRLPVAGVEAEPLKLIGVPTVPL